jgi:hypothetical protein
MLQIPINWSTFEIGKEDSQLYQLKNKKGVFNPLLTKWHCKSIN